MVDWADHGAGGAAEPEVRPSRFSWRWRPKGGQQRTRDAGAAAVAQG